MLLFNQGMRKKSELLFSVLLVPVDFITLLASFVAAYAWRVKLTDRPVAHPLGIEFYIKVFLILVPIWILIFALVGLYNQSALRGRLQEIGKIFVGVSAAVMVTILLDFGSKTSLFPSKAVPVYAFIISLVAVTLAREVVRLIQRSLFRLGIGTYQTVIVGSGPLAQQLVASLHHSATSGFEIIGALDNAKGASGRMKPIRVDRNLTNLQNRLKGQRIDTIIQADSKLDQDEVIQLVEYASNNGIIYQFVPNQFGLFAAHSEMGTLAGMPMVAMKRTPLDGWGRVLKRLFDFVASLLAIIVFSPLMLAIAIAIKLTDGGAVFFRQQRISRSGTKITIMKFRSMYEKYSTGADFSGRTEAEIFTELGRPDLVEEFKRDAKVKHDPRVSPVGAFLRRTSLDELPQLYNILMGDISLVGPRPIQTAELQRYGSGQSTFLSLKPGLTGLWQVSGRSDISYDERVKLDLYYVENWSFWLDLKIILKTVMLVVKGRGAY